MDAPDRFGSQDQEHFNAAYRRRPLLMAAVTGLYLLVFLFAILGVVGLISGQFLKGVGALILAGVSFAWLAVLHNWALTNPR